MSSPSLPAVVRSRCSTAASVPSWLKPAPLSVSGFATLARLQSAAHGPPPAERKGRRARPSGSRTVLDQVEAVAYGEVDPAGSSRPSRIRRARYPPLLSTRTRSPARTRCATFRARGVALPPPKTRRVSALGRLESEAPQGRKVDLSKPVCPGSGSQALWRRSRITRKPPDAGDRS
jgi:hypothetical protein